MLMYDLLKNHAGILLCGDYKSLCSLHEVIHQVNEKSVLIKDKDGPFLGLAYDLRKAYEGQRRKFKAPAHYPEIGPSFGVEIIWPVILLQCSMLRAALAFFDCTKRHQAFTFALEDLVEAALIADFGANAPEIIANWQRIDPRMPWAEEKLSSRGAQFCQWTKAQRRVGLAGLLASLDPLYPSFYPEWTRKGVKHLVSPEALDALADAEWEDPHA